MTLFNIKRFHFPLSIRKKLLLVLLILLVIPILGLQDILELEAYLRKEQESSLLENALIVSSVLQDYPRFFESEIHPEVQQQHYYVRPLDAAINVNGYADDWELYSDRIQSFHTKNKDGSSGQKTSLAVDFQIGSFNRYLYVLFQVSDDKIVYRQPNNDEVISSDHLRINIEGPSGKIVHYIVSTYSPGLIHAYELLPKKRSETDATTDNRISAFWQETVKGYNIELRIPISILGNKLGFSIIDIDNATHPKITNIINTAGSSSADDMATIIVPSNEISDLLLRLKRRNERVWVVDKNARVIARAGNLIELQENEISQQIVEDDSISFNQFVSGVIRLVYKLILKQPTSEFLDDVSNASLLSGNEVTAALQGSPATQWRKTPDDRVNILRAAYPVRINNEIVGSVAIEATSNSILLLQNRAIIILTNLSLLAFLLATMSLLLFATRLSTRIRRLRDEADKAIGPDGKVQASIKSSSSSDEIGDLTRSFSNMLDRLYQYNKYLETMASKLSHEFRTPITVVRSSLENLESTQIDAENTVYITRAREGIDRLSSILTRMSEATRLEQTLQQEDKQLFDIEQVTNGCVNGYQIANPNAKIELSVVKRDDSQDFTILGSPDLIAQMLDKLVSNALDFSHENSPICVTLERQLTSVQLSVKNTGPLLPSNMQNNIFDSMVSVREKSTKHSHLGLGLYIVRMISDFHHGKITANNLEDNSGVCFTVEFPLN